MTKDSEDQIGERLLAILEEHGIKYKRCRPKKEQCWAKVHFCENKRSKYSRRDVEIKHNTIRIFGGEYPDSYESNIRFGESEICVFDDDCISVGNDDGFVNFYGGKVKTKFRKEEE